MLIKEARNNWFLSRSVQSQVQAKDKVLRLVCKLSKEISECLVPVAKAK